jgi:histidyl-tRNA synthetase
MSNGAASKSVLAAVAAAFMRSVGGRAAQSMTTAAGRSNREKKGIMNKIAAPRGTADVIPPRSGLWQEFEARARQIAHRFGYGEIRTPMFEATELFVRGVGETTDIVEKEMYTFTDKGERSLTLRPEWTAPVVRAVLEHQLLQPDPRRLYYVGPIFRYERPQAGRYRQAHQFGIECFGYTQPEADVEAIQLAYEIIRSYNLNVTLHINSIGCPSDCRPRFRAALTAHFEAYREALSADSQRRLDHNPLRLLDSKAAEDQPFIASAPRLLDLLCVACGEHFARVCALLDTIGVLYQIDTRIVRGLDYYTRTVFEFVSENLGAQSTVCAGGRYDGLVEALGGRSTPGVGFAMGIERFLMLVERAGGIQKMQREGITLLALGEFARTSLMPLLAELRRNGDAPIVSMDYTDGSLGSQLKWAVRANARVALILGDDELARGELLFRDLESRTQQLLKRPANTQVTVELILRCYRELGAEKELV